jgi:fructokinase
VAAAVATLGHPAAFVSALGRDALGDDLVALLASKGVDTTGVQRVDAPTRDVYVVFTPDGDRQFVGFGAAPADAYADAFLDASALPGPLLASAGALVTGTLGLAYPATAAAMRAAVKAVKAASGAVVIDVNWRPVFFADPDAAPAVVRPYVDNADIVKLAEEEAEWLLGVPAADALDAPDAVLARLPSAAGVLVTGGGAGCAYAFRGPGGKAEAAGRVPAFPVTVADTTGAGDAFLGGFVAAALDAGGLAVVRSDAGALRAAVEFGAAAGALTATAPGAIDAQPTRARVEEMLGKGK